MASFGEFLSSLDPDAGKRGRQFEHFVKWFLKNDPEWSTQVDQIWLWDEYPNNWGRDCGIDLVFKHKNGENWAVQAKCYAPTTQITKADVDSFISESNRDGIDKRLLIATTDLIGANAKQVCDAQDKPVTRFLLSHFEDADVEYPATLDDLPKAKRKDKPKPRDHQIEAIDAVASNFKDVDRGQLIMACGTGKTFTTLWIKEKLGVESTLVLLPSLGLLSQTLHEWTLAANEEFQVLCVCSDESVGKKGSDEAVHSVADLAFPVTSSTNEIRTFLKSSGKKVIFSTYQSSPLIAEAQIDKAVPAFDLAIADEAHRCAGKVSGDFSTILDGEKIRAKKRLFTTATPRTYTSNVKKAAEDRGVEVVGMDDEAVFGKQLFALNFGEAIKRGLLTDYRVVIIGVDDPTISAWIENRELLKADSDIEMDAESLAAQVGLLKAIKDYNLHRLISFHSRVSRAEDFSQDIHKVLSWIDEKHKPSGELQSDFVSGEMPTDKRRRKLSQLKGLKDGQRGLLANARCLSEGVDVPSLDGVAFIDPRSSQIDIIQAVGRAIRLSENKKAGTIVLPVFIANSDDPEQALEEGNFKPIWDVLNALKAHDDVLADELNKIRTELGRKGGGKVNPGALTKISIDLPVGIDKSFGDGLRTLLVERSTAPWDFYFGLLESYNEEHKTTIIPQNFSINDYNLCAWINYQRASYKRNELPLNRVQKLEEFDDWSFDLLDYQWNAYYSALKEFIEKNNKLPLLKEVYKSLKIGVWVLTQKQTYVGKRGFNLSEERIKKLESLPLWSWLNTDEKVWLENYSFLKSYLSQNNNQYPPRKLRNNGVDIGVWIITQRQMINKGAISEDHYRLIKELPNWSDNPFEENWNNAIRNLKEYEDTNRNLLVPALFKSHDFQLGGWVRKQRFEYAKGTLKKERIEVLESFKTWVWDIDDHQEKVGIAHLIEFENSYGHCDVPQNHVDTDGYALGQWVSSKRTAFKDGRLSQERIANVEAIPNWSWDSWNTGIKFLDKYFEEFGNYLVPHKFMVDNFYLGRWVTSRRAEYQEGALAQDRIDFLNQLKGWSWVKRVDKKTKKN